MGKLIYSLNVSLDGFVETVDHRLDWTAVDDELHTWFNDQVRTLDASLYGRRMYELMSAYWPTAESDPAATEPMRDFARIWNAMPKIVFSTTLDSVDWNSRLVAGDVCESASSSSGRNTRGTWT
jgi:dihydrofolate reductase